MNNFVNKTLFTTSSNSLDIPHKIKSHGDIFGHFKSNQIPTSIVTMDIKNELSNFEKKNQINLLARKSYSKPNLYSNRKHTGQNHKTISPEVRAKLLQFLTNKLVSNNDKLESKGLSVKSKHIDGRAISKKSTLLHNNNNTNPSKKLSLTKHDLNLQSILDKKNIKHRVSDALSSNKIPKLEKRWYSEAHMNRVAEQGASGFVRDYTNNVPTVFKDDTHTVRDNQTDERFWGTMSSTKGNNILPLKNVKTTSQVPLILHDHETRDISPKPLKSSSNILTTHVSSSLQPKHIEVIKPPHRNLLNINCTTSNSEADITRCCSRNKPFKRAILERYVSTLKNDDTNNSHQLLSVSPYLKKTSSEPYIKARVIISPQELSDVRNSPKKFNQTAPIVARLSLDAHGPSSLIEPAVEREQKPKFQNTSLLLHRKTNDRTSTKTVIENSPTSSKENIINSNKYKYPFASSDPNMASMYWPPQSIPRGMPFQFVPPELLTQMYLNSMMTTNLFNYPNILNTNENSYMPPPIPLPINPYFPPYLMPNPAYYHMFGPNNFGTIAPQVVDSSDPGIFDSNKFPFTPLPSPISDHLIESQLYRNPSSSPLISEKSFKDNRPSVIHEGALEGRINKISVDNNKSTHEDRERLKNAIYKWVAEKRNVSGSTSSNTDSQSPDRVNKKKNSRSNKNPFESAANKRKKFKATGGGSYVSRNPSTTNDPLKETFKQCITTTATSSSSESLNLSFPNLDHLEHSQGLDHSTIEMEAGSVLASLANPPHIT